ncbi:MAG: non-ribosomal peptide synthetase, partial [bacterium]|nr:non-ribosomal peptide synthetase [bacterium]
TKYLCAYIIAGDAGPGAESELREYLAQTLPEYMIPTFFVNLEKIPLTVNGKVNKKALPEPAIKTTTTYTAPRNEVEEKLAAIWSEELNGKTGRAGAKVGIDDNFFELGGHSLKATIMMSRIHKEMGVKLTLEAIFSATTLKQLAATIGKTKKEEYETIEPAAQREYYAVSSAQKRIYILHQMDENNTGYNMFETILLEGDLDREKLEKTFRQLITRHESLRTTFQVIDGEAVQKICGHGDVTFSVENYEAKHQHTDEKRNETIRGKIKEFIRPFDLTRAPLIRVGLIKMGETPSKESRHVLVVDMHHIVSDGISTGIIVNDFTRIYDGEELPPLKLQYKDFSQWQRSDRNRNIQAQQEAYWLKTFDDEIPVLDLPADFTRPAVQEYTGTTLEFEEGAERTAALRKIALQNEGTLYMVLMAVFNILISKITNREDIIIGTPVTGRSHRDLEHIVGMFVNTLAIRNKPVNEKTITEFIQEVKKKTVQTFETQVYLLKHMEEQKKITRG